jgi:drug/metabolite transporter (DMT)-like permease
VAGHDHERRTTLLAALALLSVTAMWGSTFFLTKDLLLRVPTTDYLAVRFTIAALLMLVIAPRAVARLPRDARRHAVVLGVLYGLAQIVHTEGLAHTAASVSGFITGLYVVATPLLAAVLLGHRITAWTWGAVVLATVGLAVLSLQGLAVGYGEGLTLVSAVLYALHIVGLGAWSRPRDALGMSILQLVVIALVCSAAAVPDGLVPPPTGQDWVAVVYMAAFAGAGALVAQTWAQAHLSPTRSALIMSMEPVFAAFFAVWLGGEDTGPRMLVGGAMVLAAMLLVEAGPRRKIEGEVPHLTV